MKLFLFFLITLLFISCDNNVVDTSCEDSCDYIGQFQCNKNSLEICQKDNNGCFRYEFIQNCKTDEVCADNQCTLKKDTCEGVTCSENEICEVQEGEGVCVCKTGYHLDGENCIENVVAPCEGVTCSENEICELGVCVCKAGFYLDGDNCVECTEARIVLHACNNHGNKVISCSNGVWGDEICECDTGWSGVNCESCKIGYHDESGECVEDAVNSCADYITRESNNDSKETAFELDFTDIWKSRGYDNNEKNLNTNANTEDCNYAEDWYKIDLNIGEDLLIDIKFTDSDGNLNLYLYDNSESFISIQSSRSKTNNENINTMVSREDTYYIKVSKEQNIYSMKVEKKCNYNDDFGECISSKCTIINSTVDEHKYLYCKEKIVWNDAKNFCENFGGYLATINNQAEDNFIKNNITTDISIGLNDKENEAGNDGLSSNWKWIENDSGPTYRNWDTREPNDGGPMGNEDCVLKKASGKWNDISCDSFFSKNHFICEFD